MDETVPLRYEIIVMGPSGRMLSEAAGGLEIAEVAGGRIRLVGDLSDQPALIGLLNRLQDLRFEVLEVHQVS